MNEQQPKKRFQIDKLEERIAPAPAMAAIEALREANFKQGYDGGLCNASGHANENSAVVQAALKCKVHK